MIQIINLDITEFKEKLLDCHKIHDIMLYNSTYMFLDSNSYIRIQKDRGKKSRYITYLYKNIDDENYGFVDESTVLKYSNNTNFHLYDTVDNMYNSTVEKLKKIGKVIEIEKERELWICNNIKISIDDLPGLEEYIEITSTSKINIFNFLRIMGYEGYEIKYFEGTPIDYYKYQYGINLKWIIKNIPQITFNNVDKLKKLNNG